MYSMYKKKTSIEKGLNSKIRLTNKMLYQLRKQRNLILKIQTIISFFNLNLRLNWIENSFNITRFVNFLTIFCNFNILWMAAKSTQLNHWIVIQNPFIYFIKKPLNELKTTVKALNHLFYNNFEITDNF